MNSTIPNSTADNEAKHLLAKQHKPKPGHEPISKEVLEELYGRSISTKEYKKMMVERGHHLSEPATRIRTAAQRLVDANNASALQKLFGPLWETPGIGILAGDTGVGKSVLAVLIGHLISSDMTELLGLRCDNRHKIIYFDFELLDRQFAKRFANLRFTEDFSVADTSPFTEEVEEFSFKHICASIDQTGAKIIILDNITALAAFKSTADAEVSIGIMRGLKQLQRERGISSLVLAHTPKIPASVPLTLNHLAGSKHLSNLADSVFFIGRSAQHPRRRYIKQVKNRTNEELEGVLICEMNDEPGYLNLSLVGYDEEANHLAAAEGKSFTPRKAPLPGVLAVLPTSLSQPQSAGQLELHLATRFATDARTIRKRLKELADTNAQVHNEKGQLCAVAKDQQGREAWYSLQPVLIAS